jgi:NitT/TauT family transport system ATP-binding protein
LSFVEIQDTMFAFTGDSAVVDGVQWQVAAGEFHCLLGRSGCGKTTLLKLVAGLLQPLRGSVFIDSNPVKEPSQDVGFVFQAPTLLEWQTTLENVLLPISLRNTPSQQDNTLARELLALVGLGEMTERFPRELSGGQQSRVALARALIRQPKMLLMDEPFAALDAITREELQDDLLTLCRTRNTTVLFVTHDIAEAVYLADRVAVMANGKICAAIDVNLARPRAHSLRYESDFNTICSSARQAMDEAA